MTPLEAPTAEEDRQHECPNCETESPFVIYDGDKVCQHCAHVPGTVNARAASDDDWQHWWEHRRREYSGWHGHERVRMIGGFPATYDFGADFLSK